MKVRARGRTGLVFACTSLSARGGIASANRNVMVALRQLATNHRSTLTTLALHEPHSTPTMRGFSGDRIRFSAALLLAASRNRLLVVDHVRLGLPLLGLPRACWPRTAFLAHGSESWKRLRRTSARLFERSDIVLTNSQYTFAKMKQSLHDFSGSACALGLPCHVPLAQEPRPQTALAFPLRSVEGRERSIGSRALLLVGRLDPGEREKGHHELLEVFPRVLAEFPDAQLIFAGAGADRDRLALLTRAQGVERSVFLPGGLSNERLFELYAACYAYVMPSRQEGFGLVYLEAMNWAKPCVACRDDGGADVVVHGETGLLVDQPLSLEQLASTLLDLLRDPNRARRMGEAGWRRLQQGFTADHHVERLLDALEPLYA